MMITISILRPDHGIEIFSMDEFAWSTHKTIHIYPDGVKKDQNESDFPYTAITIMRKHPGHFVIAQNDRERWVLKGFTTDIIDLGVFSPEWHGCNAVFLMEKYDA